MSQRSYVDAFLDIVWSARGPAAPADGGVSTTNLRAVLTCIAKHATWSNGEGSYPIQDTLKDESGVSRAGVNRAIKLLVELGWIEKVKGAPNRLRGVTYKLIIPTAQMSHHDTNEMSHGETHGVNLSHGETNKSLTMRQTIVSPCDTTHVLTQAIKPREKEAAATRTHESAPTHEGQPPAAGQGLDLEKPDRGRQAAASERPAQTSTVQHGELSAWLVGELKARKAELVRTDASATPSQVKVCVAAVVALAAGDEGAARRYIEDRLTGFALRGEGRPKSLAVLLGFLVDRGDYAAWERERHEASAQHSSMRRPAHSGSGHYNDPAMKALADIIVM